MKKTRRPVHPLKKHSLKLFVPHHSNGYRPHAVRLPALALFLVVALVAQLSYGLVVAGRASAFNQNAAISAADLLTYTNEEREAEGLPDLAYADKLERSAGLKLQDMFDNDYWAHVSPGGVEPWKWFDDAEYVYAYAGENLARNYPTARATVTAWMDSPTHRANILNKDYADVGFAVGDGEIEGSRTTIVVAHYGQLRPGQVGGGAAGTSAPAETSAPVAVSGFDLPKYFTSAVESMNPVSWGILSGLALLAGLGLFTHAFRSRAEAAATVGKGKNAVRPNPAHRYHGMFVFWGAVSLGILTIIFSGGGQI